MQNLPMAAHRIEGLCVPPQARLYLGCWLARCL